MGGCGNANGFRVIGAETLLKTFGLEFWCFKALKSLWGDLKIRKLLDSLGKIGHS
jgi:hypothetical protein